jgi:ATP-dependent helicase HrpA
MAEICYPEDLPITARRVEIVELLRAHQVLVIAGETGSGKTTQLPKMCIEAGLAEGGRIGCTQPRRVAALSVSRRVAEELGVTWGREVGCKMRFNDDTGPETRVKFMTDGILLAEIQTDPLLRAYSALILDEAHERSLNIDFLLGYLQGLLKRRPELKVIITSATIDIAAFSQAFGGAPVVEVSGRLWPVDVRYRPLELGGREGRRDGQESAGYIEVAVQATEDALLESDDGDVLVFLPTERDIREAREWMEESLGRGIEVLALYGRMPAAEQQRIFTPGPRRRVILATNVAETSLTLPRIRCVVDTGLARISRYNPRTRTKRLPVEEISQSSANQRAGRAGRLGPGIAIRLYAEEEFENRPRFTQPELQRANLAEVILRMKAFGLGEIETFPFLNPPVSASIRAGYRLLHELGALDELNQLTGLGKELARLPLDPVLGRMLLQARQEQALPEVLVIAAGLSIPDPRERPEEQKDAAQTAHRKFAHPRSDFLSLLEIWRQCPSGEGRGGSNALRRFCKGHFLSFTRMREWRDIHRQLEDAFPPESRGPLRELVAPAALDRGAAGRAARLNRPLKERDAREADPAAEIYGSVHRAILSGLLGQIAQRQERNRYKASGNRLLTVFPGSHLFERQDKPKKARGEEGGQGTGGGRGEKKARQPDWIMAAEVVETSQLFARTAAGINPEWVVDLGAHLCEARHSEPYWSAKAGRVLVLERTLLHGLEVARRHVDYGRVDSAHATELFIRGALVAAEIQIPLRFFSENQRVREKVETSLTRVRHNRVLDMDEVLYRFYAARIQAVSSLPDLNRFIAQKSAREPDFCLLKEADLLGEADATFDRTLFPDQVELGNTALPLSYHFDPGEETDGVTVQVSLPMAEQLTSGQIQWMVPGLRHEQIQTLLRALPKVLRRSLMPLDVRAGEVAREFTPGRGEFLPALAEFLTRRYRVHIKPSDWPAQHLPAHLCPRVEVVDKSARPIAAGRDLEAIQQQIAQLDHRSGAWQKAARQWERSGLVGWSFGDLPETVLVEEVGGVPVLAYPGIEAAGESVNVRLYKKAAEAAVASVSGIRKLVELGISRDLVDLSRELLSVARKMQAPKREGRTLANSLQQLGIVGSGSPAGCTPEAFQVSALRRLVEHAFAWTPGQPLELRRFEVFLENGRRALPGLAYQLAEWIRQVLLQKEALQAFPKRYKGMEADVERLVPGNLPEHTPFAQLQHLPRYLKAIQVRAERAVLKPAKDAEKAAQILQFQDWRKRVAPERREAFRWLLEEFRVSLFAQELGTAESVSAARLSALLEG